MCGIAGVVDAGAFDHRSSVEGQLRQLDHRGPDSWATYARGCAVIGQTRLAVIDLVTGDPPITNGDGTVGVALNGEIYNFHSLRHSLRREGHKLRTEGDTEVIAHLAEDLEPIELAQRLEGMFAFAVWDDRRQRLVLGRDRFGKKPLYYWADGDRLVFGSEIKAVLAHPQVSRDLDPEAIPPYLTFGYVPTPRTFFKDVLSVPPGHVLTFEPGPSGADLRIEPYWEMHPPGTDGAEVLNVSLPEAAREVRRLLDAAVDRRLEADVPLGAFLSGGVDSSAVVGLMAQHGSQPVRTFTIGFEDDDGFDERAHARRIAERFGTDHTEFVVTPDAVDLVERLVWHHDQPFGDSSAIPTFLLSELTRQHVTVALCGDGGDELFGGYRRFAAALLLARYQLLPAPVRRTVAGAASVMPARAGPRVQGLRRFLTRSDRGVEDAFLDWVSYVPAHCRQALLGSSSDWGVADYHAKWRASAGASVLDRLLDVTVRTYLLDDLLPKVDRMAMAHGLEVRSPFLDRELAEFAVRLPPSTKVRVMAGKRVLKRAVADLVPDDILNRRKQGFALPLDRWFRSDLRPYLQSTVGAADARLRVCVDGAALDRMLADHDAGRANHRDALWTLLTLEVFLRAQGW